MVQGAWLLVIGITLSAFGASVASAHQQTERYIPIGQSPGVTARLVGAVTERSGDRVEVDGRTVIMTDATPVWVDRSGGGRAALEGTPADCRRGSYVEISYREEDGKLVANWVKVRAN